MESFDSNINPSVSVDDHQERRSRHFHPSVWGDFFLAFESVEIYPEEEKVDMKILKEGILLKLSKTSDENPLKLDLIDKIQRLGVSYHFEDEINGSLSNIYDKMSKTSKEAEEESLHTVALRFRLLRQQGLRVSTDMLRKFLNKEGEIDESLLTSDLQGMLSLYEASHYGLHGENIFDDALMYTTAAMNKYLMNCKLSRDDGFTANKIDQALQWPVRKVIRRLGARLYISLCQQDPEISNNDDVLLKFAILDYNAVQRLHKQELCALTKWTKSIDYVNNFPFARDRLVENYYAMMAFFHEPQYTRPRITMTKALTMITVMDDIYDTYGTMDEILLCTDAIQRWNKEQVNLLPSYMRPFYNALLDVYSELEEELAKYGRSAQVGYAIGEFQKMVKGYCQAAEWYHAKYLPTLEEYFEKIIRTSMISVCLINGYMGMENDVVTQEVLNWATSEPFVMTPPAIVFRIMNDIRDYNEDEINVANAVNLYRKQYGVSKKEAVDELYKTLDNAWKDMNSESLLPTAVPLIFIERAIDAGRVFYSFYKDMDGFTQSKSLTYELIKSVLADHIVI